MASTTSSADYKFFALLDEPPYRAGMVQVDNGEQGAPIEVAAWELSAWEVGSFVAGIPAPLGIGTLALVNGEHVHGFVSESYAVADAMDITHFCGWRAYLNSM